MLNGPVQVIATMSNGQFYIGGHFTTVDGLTRQYIARMNADGSFDGPFNPDPDNAVTAITVQSDGKVLVGGLFDLVTPDGATTSTTVGSLFPQMRTGRSTPRLPRHQRRRSLWHGRPD